MAKRETSPCATLFVGVILLTVIALVYVLGSGPTALLISRNQIGLAVWNKAYWPLLRLCDGTPVEDPVQLYINWWVNLPDSEI
jgi:hypothetical protein